MKFILTSPFIDLYALREQGRVRIECTRCGARGRRAAVRMPPVPFAVALGAALEAAKEKSG